MKLNYLLQVYNHDDKVIHSEEFFASTAITADKIALGIVEKEFVGLDWTCLLYTSPSPRDRTRSRMPSSA